MLGVGVLPNYSLRFTYRSLKDGMGRADIVEEGGKVEGKVFEIPLRTLKEYLYRREGVPTAYRPTFITIDINGSKAQVLTFVVTSKTSETAPPDWYEEEILRGADRLLTNDYVSKIKAHMNSLKNENK
jgi:cation transport regulator ChaC